MEDKARFAVGIDVGTNFVRTVLGTVKGEGLLSGQVTDFSLAREKTAL